MVDTYVLSKFCKDLLLWFALREKGDTDSKGDFAEDAVVQRCTCSCGVCACVPTQGAACQVQQGMPMTTLWATPHLNGSAICWCIQYLICSQDISDLHGMM
mmetsp:Transcript_25364/g.45843  ORF Transcript_25364/g.45843 Transcript_25364/m.45843 type:complete len:101 (+) Transcript_25364:1350-1652(+)